MPTILFVMLLLCLNPVAEAGLGPLDNSATGGDSRYVNVTGDTMTGNLTVPDLTATDDIWAKDALIVDGTGTIVGNAFSVGGSTLVVRGGKVGIGTTDPAEKLEVSGSTGAIRLTSTKDGSWTVGETKGGINFYSSDTSGSGAGIGAYIKAVSPNTVGAATDISIGASQGGNAGIETLRIKANENEAMVGISTDTPTAALTVKNSGTTVPIITAMSNAGATVLTVSNTGDITASSSMTVQGNAFSVGGSTLVVAGGKVGAGANPTANVDISFPYSNAYTGTLGISTVIATSHLRVANAIGVGNPYSNITMTATGGDASIGVGAIVFQHANSSKGNMAFALRDGGDVLERMRLTSAGNVGISTTAPAITLDVQGQMGAKDYTLAQMEALVPGRAGALIAISNAAAPYTYCVSTGTAAGSWVKLNTADHCQ